MAGGVDICENGSILEYKLGLLEQKSEEEHWWNIIGML